MALKITSAEFITSAPSLQEAPTWSLPEIAMVGRSNVGKSSLINTLVSRKNLAKTSNTPGKTRLINFYDINHQFALVDLPGYGYAKVSKAMQAQWQKNLEAYLQKRQNLAAVIQLIDARHDPQASDLQMLAWLRHHRIPVIPVLTKCDKISRSQRQQHLQRSVGVLGIPVSQIIAFSAETAEGKPELLSCIEACLHNQG